MTGTWSDGRRAMTAAPAAATHNDGTGPGGDFAYGTGGIFVFLPPFGAF